VEGHRKVTYKRAGVGEGAEKSQERRLLCGVVGRGGRKLWLSSHSSVLNGMLTSSQSILAPLMEYGDCRCKGVGGASGTPLAHFW
jgi:hypothetical protein